MSRYNVAVGDVRHVAIPGSAQYGAVIDGPFQSGSPYEEWLVVPIRAFEHAVSAAPDEIPLSDDGSTLTYLALAWCAQPIRTALLGDLFALLSGAEISAITRAVGDSEEGETSLDEALWADGERHRELGHWALAALESPVETAAPVFSREYLERQVDMYAADPGTSFALSAVDIARIDAMANAFYASTFGRQTGEHRVIVPVTNASAAPDLWSLSEGGWKGTGFQPREVQRVQPAPRLQSVA